MKIYIDYVFFINFLFDYILLITTSIILKRNISKKRLLFASFIGGISGVIIFFDFGNIMFILKMLFGLLIVIICFKYKDFKYTFINFIYLIMISTIIGGVLYLLNLEFGYQDGTIMFFSYNKKFNSLILIILYILICLIYTFINKHRKTLIKTNYEVDLLFENKKYKFNGFLDTGNKLHDPYFNKPVVILNKDLGINIDKFYFVPYKTVNNKGILKCFMADLDIKGVGIFKKVMVGISNDKVLLSGIDIILNIDLLEGI